METGVARRNITDWEEYKLQLRARVRRVHDNYGKTR